MRKLWVWAAVAVVSAVIALNLVFRFIISPYDGGPLDSRPRLEASAESRGHGLTVEVLRQRDPSYSIARGAEVFVQVHDRRGEVVYRRQIARDGAWDELDAQYRITFEPDEIRVQPYDCRAGGCGTYHAIKLSELKADSASKWGK